MMKRLFIILSLLTSSIMANNTNSFRFGEGEYSFERIQERKLQEEQDAKNLEWAMNPLASLMTRETYEEEILGRRLDERDRRYSRGKVITIDTRDSKECYDFRDKMIASANYETNKFDDLCSIDEENPYASVVVVENDYKIPLTLDKFSQEDQNLIRQTRNFGGLGVATIGLLFMLPESVTKWDVEKLKQQSLGERWKEKVKEGPVIDKDHWAINYIGHPLSGAAYYTVARHAGAGVMKSFGYSVLMSTFFWEYGLEAFAETPSIQDLIITPIIGSLIGEGMYKIESKIAENGGVLLRSKKLGAFVMGLMNPAGGLLDLVNKPFESKIFKSADFSFTMMPPKSMISPSGMDEYDSFYLGLNVEFKF